MTVVGGGGFVIIATSMDGNADFGPSDLDRLPYVVRGRG